MELRNLIKKEIYEPILLEFLNTSKFMIEINNGNLYKSPNSEDNGEYDAIGCDLEHSIDFKLLVSKANAELKSLTRHVVIRGKNTHFIKRIESDAKKIKIAKNKYVGYVPDVKFRKTDIFKWSIEAGQPITVDILTTLNSKESLTDNNDLQSIINVLKKNKNILLFLPKNIKDEQLKEHMIDYYNYDNYKYLLKYRPHDKKTYFCYISEKIIKGLNFNDFNNIKNSDESGSGKLVNFYIFLKIYECTKDELKFLDKIDITNFRSVSKAFDFDVYE